MQVRRQIEELWPTRVGFYQLEGPEAEAQIAALYAKAWRPPQDNRTASERRIRGIMAEALELQAAVRDCVADYLGPGAEFLDPTYCENRALLIEDRAFINTHADSREGDVTAVLFLSGGGAGQPINSVGNPRFCLEDPSRYADQPRLPFESRPAYSINPAPGLIVIFPSWIPHNQHPYRGEVTHIQVVLNFRVEIPEHLQEKWFD